MLLVIISLIIFLLLILMAIRISFNNKETNIEVRNTVLHTSGIYSIIRKDPRDKISQVKPSEEEIRKYLENINVNTEGIVQFSQKDIDVSIHHWIESLNKNIKMIQQGDIENTSFYYYDFIPEQCPVCKDYLKKGQFVTREEVFNFPGIIPPFHIGCTCMMISYGSKNTFHDTTELGMIPLFKNDNSPRLPEWKMISPLAVRGKSA